MNVRRPSVSPHLLSNSSSSKALGITNPLLVPSNRMLNMIKVQSCIETATFFKLVDFCITSILVVNH